MPWGLGSLSWEHTDKRWPLGSIHIAGTCRVGAEWLCWSALVREHLLKLSVQSLLSWAMEGTRLPVAPSGHLQLCRKAVISVKSMALSFCTWGSGRSCPPKHQWLDGARNWPLAELDKMGPPPLQSCSKSCLARLNAWVLATAAELLW